jgi:hypothetical protein
MGITLFYPTHIYVLVDNPYPPPNSSMDMGLNGYPMASLDARVAGVVIEKQGVKC